MAMTTRSTRGGNQLMELVDAFFKKEAKAEAPKKLPKPLFPGTAMKPSETYRLPIKKGSRGKGTRKG